MSRDLIHLVIVSIVILIAGLKDAHSAQSNDLEKLAMTHAIVGATGVGTAIGYFVLVDNGKGICAIRFNSIRRGDDAKPATWYRTGGPTIYADYDSYYQADPDKGFSSADVESGHGEVSWGEWRGLGHWLSWSTGDPFVRCGSFKFRAYYPDLMSLVTNDAKLRSNNLKVSPTGWKNLDEVDLNNPNLVWFTYDDHRKRREIPVDSLANE